VGIEVECATNSRRHSV